MRRLRTPGRRGFLSGMGVAWAGLAAGPALGAGAAAERSLIVAGPPGGRVDRWADVLAPALGLGMAGHAPLPRRHVGGLDGVTGANRFQARGDPDGGTALLAPGAALLAWLAGDVRAKFNPARWVTVWACTGPAALVSRHALAAGRTLRVAAAGPAGPELPFLLALDLMGVKAVLSGAQEADALVMQGPELAGGLAATGADGMRPVLTLGALGADAAFVADPLLPEVPTVLQATGQALGQALGQARAQAGAQAGPGEGRPELWAGLQAAVAAALLDAGLMLPQLTPAASVSVWRQACEASRQDAAVVDEAARQRTRLLSPVDAARCMGRVAGDAGALLAVRGWLAARHEWRPT